MSQRRYDKSDARSLKIVFPITFLYFIIEVIFSPITNSFALFSDAAHKLTENGSKPCLRYGWRLGQRTKIKLMIITAWKF